MLKILLAILPFLIIPKALAKTDLVVIGDSQVGATWSQSYTGNFLTECLSGEYLILGRGATVLSSWLGNGKMDHIETIQRDKINPHLNIGSKENVPVFKKRISSIIEYYQPKKVAFNFGGNYISMSNEIIENETLRLKQVIEQYKIAHKDCYFITPTYEMEVRDHRNVPLKNLSNIQRINRIITSNLGDHCQIIDGLEVMNDSIYFDGNELLKRINIVGRSGCMGAAQNDNTHVCGEAARDYAQRLCQILN